MSDRSLECLLLSEPDIIAAGALDMAKCVRTMDEVFHLYGQGDWLMSGADHCDHGAGVVFPKDPPIFNMPRRTPDRRYVAIVGYLGGRFRCCGGKYYGSNRENLKQGLPRSILTGFLSDADTGAPLAIMSASIVSSMRTGAMPGVAAKYLQSSHASVIGIVGAGVISRACLMSICETIHNKKEALVYDLIPERSQAFVEEMSKRVDIPVRAVDSMEELARESDVISLASSGVNPAYMKTEWLKPDVTIAISGGGLLDDEVYLDENTSLVIDCHKMHEHRVAGYKASDSDINVVGRESASYQYFKLIDEGKMPFGRAAELGDVVSGKVCARKNDKHRAIFMSGGLSLEDIAWMWEIYQTALRKGIGTKFKFWDEPTWM